VVRTYNTVGNSGTVLTPKYKDTSQIIQYSKYAIQLANSQGPWSKRKTYKNGIRKLNKVATLDFF
jgi:hypothetical protein